MTDPRYRLTPTDRATLGTIVTRFPGLAAAVHAQVTRLLAAVLPAGDGAIATEGRLDELLGSVVKRVVAGSGRLRGDPPTRTGRAGGRHGADAAGAGGASGGG